MAEQKCRDCEHCSLSGGYCKLRNIKIPISGTMDCDSFVYDDTDDFYFIWAQEHGEFQ